MINFLKSKINIFKQFFKNIKKDINIKLKKIQEDQNKNLNGKINNFEKNLDNLYKETLLNEIDESKKELHKLNSNIKKKSEILKDFKIPEIDSTKFLLFYSDDHPGALFQMYNDIRILLEKRTHIVEINEDLINKINEINLKFRNFQPISFKTENAPYFLDKLLNKNIIPDISILDIIYGGVVIDNNKVMNLDGIDIGKKILETNPNSIIIFYTGCSLNENTKEGNKLKELIKNFSHRIFVTDKDINDQNRIEVFYEAVKKLIELFPEKYQKALEENKEVVCHG